MISRQCPKNETTGKLTVERAPRYLRGDFMRPQGMRYGGTLNATVLGGARIDASTTAIILLFAVQSLLAQTPTPLPSSSPTDPASEPVVLAVAKVMPAVVNINAERVVRRQIRDPFEDFAAEFFGTYRSQPREVRQRLQSLGSGFIVDPAGYIVTNRHGGNGQRTLRSEATTSDGKFNNAHKIRAE